MQKFLLLPLLFATTFAAAQTQKLPCTTNPVYRQFDFWIGDWEVYGVKGQKAGTSRIELILDSCVILENWTSPAAGYAGKSFNTYNALTKQWQQTWVDNRGGSTEFLEGTFDGGRMAFRTKPFPLSKDTMAVRKLTFYKLSPDTVRQHGEISKDGGATWSTEYDLEYRRRKS